MTATMLKALKLGLPGIGDTPKVWALQPSCEGLLVLQVNGNNGKFAEFRISQSPEV